MVTPEDRFRLTQMAWLSRFFEGLFLLLTGTLVIYLIRNFLPWGCLAGMGICLVGMTVIGLIDRSRKRSGVTKTEPTERAPREKTPSLTVPEEATVSTGVGTGGISLLAKVVRAITEPIGDAVKLSLPGGGSGVEGRLVGTVIPPEEVKDPGESQP